MIHIKYQALFAGMRTVSHSQSGKYVSRLQIGEKQFLNHLLKVSKHKISIETSQFMLNLYLKLSLTSFKNKFQQNNWHYVNHMPVLNQEILINPELSHACIWFLKAGTNFEKVVCCIF